MPASLDRRSGRWLLDRRSEYCRERYQAIHEVIKKYMIDYQDTSKLYALCAPKAEGSAQRRRCVEAGASSV